MSLSGDREEVAGYLSQIDGVQGYRYRPTISDTGDAWPFIEVLDNSAGMSLQVTWRIVVVLPKGEQKASEWFDTMHEEISDVLNEQFGNVDRIEPGLLDTEAGTRNAMILTVTREA